MSKKENEKGLASGKMPGLFLGADLERLLISFFAQGKSLVNRSGFVLHFLLVTLFAVRVILCSWGGFTLLAFLAFWLLSAKSPNRRGNLTLGIYPVIGEIWKLFSKMSAKIWKFFMIIWLKKRKKAKISAGVSEIVN